MGSNEFAYWLQGALEMNPDMLEKGMTPEQVKTIQDHLDLVFDKVTPDRFSQDDAKPFIYDNTKTVPWNVPLCEDSGTIPLQQPGSTSLFCATLNQDTKVKKLKRTSKPRRNSGVKY